MMNEIISQDLLGGGVQNLDSPVYTRLAEKASPMEGGFSQKNGPAIHRTAGEVVLDGALLVTAYAFPDAQVLRGTQRQRRYPGRLGHLSVIQPLRSAERLLSGAGRPRDGSL
jgi:hypothetical protein